MYLLISNKDLQKLLESGILDEAEVLAELEMLERKKYLEKHSLSVWEGANGYFYTKLIDLATGKKKLVKKKTRKALEDAIVQHYKQAEDNPSVANIFECWSKEKLEFGEISKGSYDRYLTDYNRFFKGKSFESMLITEVEEADIEGFIRQTIIACGLTRKTYAGLRILISGIFKYAKKKGYSGISISNFFGDLQLPTRIFERKVKDNETETFTEEEICRILNYCSENPNIRNYGIGLSFVTGTRIGELAALRHEDIFERYIHVQRTEVKYRDEATGKWVVEVSAYPKTEAGDRYVILPEKGQEFIKKILELNPQGEYLFQGDSGNRIRATTFNKRLYAICKDLNIRQRSSHKARKAYATTLIDANLPDSLVMQQMGHTDIGTTRKYYYRSNTSQEQSFELINQAINF